MMFRFLQRRPWATLKTWFLLDPWFLVNSPELVKEGFFSDDFPNTKIERVFQLVQSESFLAAMETTVLALPYPKKVRTPLLVLAAENDRVFSKAEERATAKAYHIDAIFFPNIAHDMLLEKDWQKVADKILTWLSARQL